MFRLCTLLFFIAHCAVRWPKDIDIDKYLNYGTANGVPIIDLFPDDNLIISLRSTENPIVGKALTRAKYTSGCWRVNIPYI